MKKPPSENCKAVLKLKCIETGTSKTVAIYDIVREISATVSAAMCSEKKQCHWEYVFKIQLYIIKKKKNKEKKSYYI